MIPAAFEYKRPMYLEEALSHLGVPHIDMPITREKVWKVLRSAGVDAS